MILEEIIIKAKKHINKSSLQKDTDYFCTSRDIFQARLDSYILNTGNYIESAVIGEIGNNSFDHNWKFADGHMRGTYFNLNFENEYVVLADFGRGIRQSLCSVINLNSDLEAVTTGFTKQISGRLPEQRGNGLKFVAETIKNKKWSLYFQTGDACCIINDGTISFKETEDSIIGCLCILNFSGVK